jgi:hypothetical protein
MHQTKQMTKNPILAMPWRNLKPMNISAEGAKGKSSPTTVVSKTHGTKMVFLPYLGIINIILSSYKCLKV